MRFPEFSGEWERMTVSDLLDFYTTNSLSWEQLEYGSEGLFNLHYGLIHVGLPTLIDLAQNALPSVKPENMPRSFELCQEGDVAFADASEDTNEVAKVVEFSNLDGKQVVCGLHTIHGRDTKGRTTTGFKGYALSSQPFHFQIRRLAQGTKIYSISLKNFAESHISIPSKDEQSKIVSLLSLVDKRIETQNKIIEDVQSLISGVNEQLMSINGSNFVSLGDIATITNGTNDVQDAKMEYNEGLYPFYDRSEIIKYLDSFFLDKEAIIYPGEGSEFYPRYYNGKFALHQRCYAIYDLSEDFVAKYVYYYMQNLNNYFIRNAVGSTVPSLRLDTFKRVRIPILPKDEQSKICNVLDALSNKLQIEQNILKNYQIQKAYLLQQMFI